MYSVSLLPLYVEEINKVLDYLSEQLQNPQAVENLITRLEKIYEELQDNPYIFPKVRSEKWAREGYRRALAGNYICFYKIKNKSVYLTRFMHGSMDWQNRL